MEKLRSKTCVITDLCSLEMRALATAKMARKGMERVEIDVRTRPLHCTKQPRCAAARMYRTALLGAYPLRSRPSANPSMCGPLIPLRKRRNVLGAEKYVSNMGLSLLRIGH